MVASTLLSACGGGLEGSAVSAGTAGREQFQAARRTFTVGGVSTSSCARDGGVCDVPGKRKVAVADRSLTVQWVAPTTNDDGTPLDDLAGFRVYYGNSSGVYGNSATVASSTTLSHRFDNLPTGTYYVMVKSLNSAAIESNASPELSKSIQ